MLLPVELDAVDVDALEPEDVDAWEPVLALPVPLPVELEPTLARLPDSEGETPVADDALVDRSLDDRPDPATDDEAIDPAGVAPPSFWPHPSGAPTTVRNAAARARRARVRLG